MGQHGRCADRKKVPASFTAAAGNDKERFVNESVAEKLDHISREFAELEPRERLELLLEFSEKLAPLPAEYSGRTRRGYEPRARMSDPRVSVGYGCRRTGADFLPTWRPRRLRSKAFVSVLVDIFFGAPGPKKVVASEPNLVHRFRLGRGPWEWSGCAAYRPLRITFGRKLPRPRLLEIFREIRPMLKRTDWE